MAARGDEQARVEYGKASRFLDAAHQFHIFKERPRGATPDLFKDPSANKNALIPCGGFSKAAAEINPRSDDL